MAELVLKLKTKTGQLVLRELNKNHTVADLKVQLSEKCNIVADALHVLSGFPPKPLDLNNDSYTLQDLNIQTGDTLIIQEKVIQSAPKAIPTVSFVDQLEFRGVLLRKKVPADNSCLFTSIGFVLNGKIDTTCGSYMRELIAEHVRSDTVNYNEGILGMAPSEYCDWILKQDSWGGAIELSILSKYYGIEIAVVDTLNAIINRFGEDQNYPHRVFLIFDGIHYDPIYMESPQSGDMQTIFPAEELQVLEDAQVLAQESKSSRQFTDVNKFSIKCLDCQIVLKGQVEAQAHAKATSHTHFGEV